MTKAVWFHCYAGIAGDMALGSLLDAGADVDDVRAIVGALDLPDWSLDVRRVQRNNISATHVNVRTHEHGVSRNFSTIKALLERAPLPVRVRDRSLAVFTVLAKTEAGIHGESVETVHFHEVGGVDAIVDIVGTCAALEALGIDAIYASPVAMGIGTVASAHGVIPNPPPAVVKLLEGAPIFGTEQPYELTTPTGAAILAALTARFGPMPSFTSVLSSGFGAGTRELDGIPNCTQVIVGSLSDEKSSESLVVLETNVDDVTGEVLAHTTSQLISAGALDVWLTPIVMKKGRPAHTVSALVHTHDAARLSELLASETGTFGIRRHDISRSKSDRRFARVDVDGESVTVKVGQRVKAEFDDAAAVADRLGMPVREVIRRAESAWRNDTE